MLLCSSFLIVINLLLCLDDNLVFILSISSCAVFIKRRMLLGHFEAYELFNSTLNDPKILLSFSSLKRVHLAVVSVSATSSQRGLRQAMLALVPVSLPPDGVTALAWTAVRRIWRGHVLEELN